ncbi:hypothetical protein DLM_2329 [Aquitalea magnusonii]|uniref:DUF1436 domain-containing protein n=1 Tax=Aquitalea magnusonii TaxID=332411 RepID=A0A3G9GGH3_9NEIS|nr:hypothetical protein DLM_2329 [Aquitalea magnusonii]
MEPDADHHTLGLTVLQALQNSRTLSNEECETTDFFDLTAGKLRYQAWYQELMQRYGYKTKKALFKNMQLCGIHCVNGIITIIPYRHEKLEAWGGDGIEESDYVVLSTASTPEEIGAGLRLAISRCR